MNASNAGAQISVYGHPGVGGLRIDGMLSGTAPDVVQYESILYGLRQDTVYYYAVYDGNRVLAGEDDSCRFRSLPGHGAPGPLRVWVIGGHGGQEVELPLRPGAVAPCRDEKPAHLILHTGAMTSTTGSDLQFQDSLFRPMASVLRSTALWPAIGPPEAVGSPRTKQVGPYFDAFALPAAGECGAAGSNTEAYYAFRVGRTLFLSLNSIDADLHLEGSMARWVERATDLPPDVDWLVAYWYCAPASLLDGAGAGEENGAEMERVFLPLLEQAGADLILTGRPRGYRRAWIEHGVVQREDQEVLPGAAEFVKPEGAGAGVLVVSFEGAQGTRTPPAGAPAGAAHTTGFSACLRLEGNRLHVVVQDAEGHIRDAVSVRKE